MKFLQQLKGVLQRPQAVFICAQKNNFRQKWHTLELVQLLSIPFMRQKYTFHQKWYTLELVQLLSISFMHQQNGTLLKLLRLFGSFILTQQIHFLQLGPEPAFVTDGVPKGAPSGAKL